MTAGTGHQGGAEQRRFARQPINLDGWLSIAGRPPVQCTARDFCPGGMFVSADPEAYATVAPKAPATLYFALMVGGVKQDYQVKLEIARAVAKGLGVSFVDANPRTLDLLSQLASAAAPPTLATSASDLRDTQRGFAPEFAKVIGPLTTLVTERVKQLCDRFIERVDDVLFLAARDAGNNADQTRFLDGQREMRRRAPRIRDEVPPRIERGLSVLGNPLDEDQKKPTELGLSDLSLVDKDEFEEFLAISEMVSELEPEFHEPLFALGRRFGYLAQREIETSALPIGPSVLCNAIAEVLKGLQSERRAIARIYKVLHEVMSGNLGRFYEDVNKLLIEHRVLPVIEKDKPIIKRQQTSTTGAFDAAATSETAVAAADADLTDVMPGPEQYVGGAAWAPPPGSAVAGRAGPPAGHAPGIAPAPAAYPTGYATAPGPGAAPAGSAAPAYATGYTPAPSAGYAPAVAATPAAPGGQGPGVVAAPASPPPGFGPGHAGGVVSAPSGPPPGWPQAVAAGGFGPPPVLGGTAGEVAAGAVTGDAPLAAGAARPQHITSAAQAAAQLPVYHAPLGWTGGPSNWAAPSMHQGYTAAQSQLALRRQLLPEVGPGLSETMRQRGAYSQAQILDGLSELQRAFAATAAPTLLDVASVKDRITSALVQDGAPQQLVGDEATDAIEVVAGLFGALLEDALVAKSAKSHLTRLQPSVHKAALLDHAFFESDDHPVRRLINRIAQLRDGKSEQHQRRQSRVQELVAQANLNFRDDLGIFDPMVSELDEILNDQQQEYAQRVAEVVSSCEQQQRVLEQRRGSALDTTDGHGDRSDLPEEWNKWLDRSRRLEVGEQLMMNAASANPSVVSLVWKEARNNLFVFVDNQGNKASTLTLQQVAMYLRRGILRALDEEPATPALERAMVGVVDRFHSQVEAHATRDPLTGLLNRKFFVEAIDGSLPAADTSAARSVALAHISIENLKQVNDERGVAAGDALLKACVEALTKSLRGKDLLFGRLGGAELGVYWPSGGIQGAYKKLQVAVETLRNVTMPVDPEDETIEIEMTATHTSEVATAARPVAAEVVVGVTGSEDGLVQAEGLLTAAREACETAREMGTGSIYVAGNESQQRRQLEQMVAYANKALERSCLMLSGQYVASLRDRELPPALRVAVAARDRNDKPIPPHVFGPALARAESAAAIDLWALRETLAWMTTHEEAVEGYAVIMLELSAASIKNEELPGQIMSLFMESAVPPGKVCFALPDRDVVDNLVEASELISTLKEFGCRFVLDEFGSGHANYDYIKELEVDFVTVRSSFVADAQKNPKDFAMAKSINELVHFMGKKTIAKQEPGRDLSATMHEIGIDFLHDLHERMQLVAPPEA